MSILTIEKDNYQELLPNKFWQIYLQYLENGFAMNEEKGTMFFDTEKDQFLLNNSVEIEKALIDSANNPKGMNNFKNIMSVMSTKVLEKFAIAVLVTVEVREKTWDNVATDYRKEIIEVAQEVTEKMQLDKEYAFLIDWLLRYIWNDVRWLSLRVLGLNDKGPDVNKLVEEYNSK